MSYESMDDNPESSIEFPAKSKDEIVQAYIDGINASGRAEAVVNFIEEEMAITPDTYGSFGEFEAANPEYSQKIHDDITEDEKESIQRYSGYDFAFINSVARGFWDYEKMGKRTPEREASIKKDTRNIISAIAKAPAPERDFVTFRGTNLDEFYKYGIEDVSDLANMKGQFMFEEGFTSTSLVEANSFINHDDNTLWTKASDIEMRFHIPAGTKNVIALTSNEITYSLKHTEVLIDHDSLLYVSDVAIDENGRAVIDAILIPTSVIYGKELKQV